jgi:hypothetical protein
MIRYNQEKGVRTEEKEGGEPTVRELTEKGKEDNFLEIKN